MKTNTIATPPAGSSRLPDGKHPQASPFRHSRRARGLTLAAKSAACLAALCFAGLSRLSATDFCVNPGFEDGPGGGGNASAPPWSYWGGTGGAIDNPVSGGDNTTPRVWSNFGNPTYINLATQNNMADVWLIPGATYHYKMQVYVPSTEIVAGVHPCVSIGLRTISAGDFAVISSLAPEAVVTVSDQWVTFEGDYAFTGTAITQLNYMFFTLRGRDDVTNAQRDNPGGYFDNCEFSSDAYTGEISGLVKDVSGLLEGASVAITYQGSPFRSTPVGPIITLTDGAYSFAGLIPGETYSITASKAGYFPNTVTATASDVAPDIILELATPMVQPMLVSRGTGGWRDDTYTIGTTFTTGPDPVYVSALGYVDRDLNGLNVTHQVGIWQDGVLLGSVVVPAGTDGQLVGDFRYAPLDSLVVLEPATTYTVNAYTQGDSWPETAANPGFNTPDFNGFVSVASCYTDGGLGFGAPVNVWGNAGNVGASCNLIGTIAEPPMHTITATADVGGTIDPSGVVNVPEGASKTFTFIPDVGKMPDLVTIDGGTPVAAGTSYTFVNVLDDTHTIFVTFKDNPDYEPGLLVRYKFDGDGTDSSGNGKNGNLVGGATISSGGGRVGTGALDITGSNGAFSVPELGPAVNTEYAAFTMSAWVKPTQLTGWMALYQAPGWDLHDTHVVLDYSNDWAHMLLALNQGGDNDRWQNNMRSVWPHPSWHLQTIVYDSAALTVKFYFDGALVNTGTYTTAATAIFQANAYIGSGSGNVNDRPFHGKIDDFRIYGIALSDTEVADLYASYPPAVTNTIVASVDPLAPGGSISPAGDVLVDSGDAQTFTIKPIFGKQILDVLVDDISVKSELVPAIGGSAYTFTNVVAGHTIVASFEDAPLTATRYEAENAALVGAGIENDANASNGARVVAQGYGNNCTVTFAVNVATRGMYVMEMGYYQPWDGNRDTYIDVNGVSMGTIPAPNVAAPNYGTSTLSIPLIAGDNTVVLSNGPAWGPHWDYIQIPNDPAGEAWYITASAGTGGTIDPVGDVGVAAGSSRTFNIAADYGYAIADVLVDGSSVGAVPSYTFDAVLADHTIDASFITLASVSGVVSGPDGPIYDAIVALSTNPDGSSPFDSKRTSMLGEYLIVPPGDGTYYMVVSKGGYVTSTPVEVMIAGEPVIQDITLAKSAGLDPLVVLDAAALADGILTSWTNDGSLGGTFNTFDGTSAPSVTNVAGKQAVQFNQPTAEASGRQTLVATIPTPAEITGSSDWTLSTDIYKADMTWSDITYGTGENCYMCWAGRDWGTGQTAQFDYVNNLAYVHYGSDRGYNTVPSAGVWNNVTITYDGSVEKVYVNGVLDSTETRSLNLHAGDIMMVGGAYWRNARGEDQYWRLKDGAIAKLQIFDQALTASEVAALNGLATISGIVTLEDGTTPVEGATVTCVGTTTTNTTTLADGTYSIDVKLGDVVSISAGKTSYSVTDPATNLYEITVAGDTTDINFKMVMTSYEWAGANEGLWNVPANWVSSVPSAGQIAVFSNSSAAGATVDIDAPSATAGGILFNDNVANQVIMSTSDSPLILDNGGGGVTITASAGSHTISANIDSQSSGDACDFNGAGTVILSGTNMIGRPGQHMVHGWGVSGNLEIVDGSTTVAQPVAGGGDGDTANNGGISGTMVVSGGSFTAGGHDVGISGTLTVKGTGSFTLNNGGVYDIGGGTLNIQDSGTFTVDRGVVNNSWTVGGIILGMGWGPSTAIVNQDGGTVNLPFYEPWLTANGPGLCYGPGGWGNANAVKGTYNLNGGVLNVSCIASICSDGSYTTLSEPSIYNPDSAAIFNFNGGLLRATQDDNPAGADEGTDHLMVFLTHAYVGEFGAMIDTNEFTCSINQGLEHNPDAPATDGGLTKLGDGTLTLLQASTYTGPTKVQGGVLACALNDALGGGALEVETGAKLQLDYSGTKQVASLKLGGVVMGDGTYGSSDPSGLITGTGTVTVGGLSGYAGWAALYAGGQAANLDYNNDGVANGIAYFMGVTGVATNPGLDGTNTVTWPKDPAYNGTWQVQTSPDLTTWTDVAGADNGNSVSYTLPTGAGKLFVRLLVTPN